MLSKRKLYQNFTIPGEQYDSRKFLDFLQYADGKNDLKSIAGYIKKSYSNTIKIYKLLKRKKLIY